MPIDQSLPLIAPVTGPSGVDVAVEAGASSLATGVRPLLAFAGRPDFNGPIGRLGPDVSVKTDGVVSSTYVSFQVDPSTRELHISIVDEGGRIVRVIPPDSVSQMLAAMARYASTIG